MAGPAGNVTPAAVAVSISGNSAPSTPELTVSQEKKTVSPTESPETAALTSKLTVFFNTQNPEKIAAIPQIVASVDGDASSIAQLNTDLQNKYGVDLDGVKKDIAPEPEAQSADPPAPAPAPPPPPQDLKTKLTRFFSIHNTDKLDVVHKIVESTGEEPAQIESLNADLRSKYGVDLDGVEGPKVDINVDHHETSIESYSHPKPPPRNAEKSVKVKLNMPDGSFSTVLIGPNCTVAEVCGTVAFRRGYNPLVLYTINSIVNEAGQYVGPEAELKNGGDAMLPILREACQAGHEIEVRELYDKEDKTQAAEKGYQISPDEH